MTDTERVLSLLGLCRKAGLASFGHDAAKSALRDKRARLCLICEDASPRLQEEFSFLAEQAGKPLLRIQASSADIKQATQYKAAVLTVNERGFANKLSDILAPAT